MSCYLKDTRDDLNSDGNLDLLVNILAVQNQPRGYSYHASILCNRKFHMSLA